jgi:uncharacterized protein (TIRG00374 family)
MTAGPSAPRPASGGAQLQQLTRRVVLAMLLAVVIYAGFVLYRGAASVASKLETFAWSSFALACGLAFSNYVLRFLKWEYYLAVLGIRGIPKGESFATFLSGFVLTVTPGKVGEVFKSLILLETRAIPVERTAPIVVAERVTDLIGVIVLITIGSLSFSGGLVWAAIGAALVVVLLAFIASPILSRAVLDRLPRLPGVLGRLGERAAPKLRDALLGLRDLTSPRHLVLPTLLSVIAWSFEGLALWIIVRGFGEHPPLQPIVFFYATATLAGAIPISPGGLGVTEKLLEQQMALLGGVATATATAAVLLVRIATLWFAVGVGFVALAVLRAKYPGLGSRANASDAGPLEESDARNNAKSVG